ncbi:ribonuclease H-like domain, reverse transcriptase, RNA-dependent DNA polymerase [Tanacetum coccineum]|uniref:Ribonuclease H-like domain, reverse transcriptase, RNA-dependent DNA polymerase n=1 Tax=Tanacetum coccineum TaxID=301880 RepID=A0ABQ4ZXH5_9ASTR
MFAERKNRTLIEAARTMLADSLLPIQFWAEAVHTACYVLNRVLVTKPQMKTPYELLMGKSPNISMRSERKRWIFHGNSFDDENKDTEEEIDLDLNNMDNTIDVSSSSTLKIHKNHPQKMHHWSYYSRSFKQENSCKKNQRRLTQALHDEGWGRSNCKKNDSVKLQGMYEVLCDLPDGKRVIGTKWVFRNKRDIKEGDSPFIKWMSRSAFLLCAISRRGCMSIKPQLLDAWDRKDIMLVQVYVDDIIIGSNLGNHKLAKECWDFHKSRQYEEGEVLDVHLYRSMTGCLMYLTASRLDIMFAVCLCARFQVTPKVSHLNAVKRIFRYLKHQLKLGLMVSKDSPFQFRKPFSDSDYAGGQS